MKMKKRYIKRRDDLIQLFGSRQAQDGMYCGNLIASNTLVLRGSQSINVNALVLYENRGDTYAIMAALLGDRALVPSYSRFAKIDRELAKLRSMFERRGILASPEWNLKPHHVLEKLEACECYCDAQRRPVLYCVHGDKFIDATYDSLIRIPTEGLLSLASGGVYCGGMVGIGAPVKDIGKFDRVYQVDHPSPGLRWAIAQGNDWYIRVKNPGEEAYIVKAVGNLFTYSRPYLACCKENSEGEVLCKRCFRPILTVMRVKNGEIAITNNEFVSVIETPSIKIGGVMSRGKRLPFLIDPGVCHQYVDRPQDLYPYVLGRIDTHEGTIRRPTERQWAEYAKI